MTYTRIAPALLSFVLAVLAIALFATSASAETITVTRADDPTPDGCATNGCSLREAIALANTTAGNQVIDIADMEIIITSTITMTGDMTITGVNTTDSVIRTDGEIHMFSVMAGANVTFTKVWIYGAQEGGPNGCGGAIYNAGTLYLTMAKVAKNFLEAKGAGLCNVGSATVTQTEFLANSSGAQQGGAIFNSGTLDIVNSTFTDNAAIEGGALSNTVGAVLHRAGLWQEAVERLNEAVQLDVKGGQPEDWLFLAMAHHRLGDAAAARQWLARAIQALDTFYMPGEATDSAQVPSWNQRLEWQFLRGEAESLLDGSKP